MFERPLLCFCLVIGLWTFQACNKKKIKMRKSLEDVKEVFNRDKQEIIMKYRATGAGIGKDGEEYVIVVYLPEPVKEEKAEKWKAVPLKLKYVGPITIQ